MMAEDENEMMKVVRMVMVEEEMIDDGSSCVSSALPMCRALRQALSVFYLRKLSQCSDGKVLATVVGLRGGSCFPWLPRLF